MPKIDKRSPEVKGLTQNPARLTLHIDSIPASGTSFNNLQRRAYKKSPAFPFLAPKTVHIYSLARSSVDGEKILQGTAFLAASIMDLWSVIRADLTIADLIRPAEGFGPHCTIPAEFGCLVAGKDPVAVDATVCRMVGLDISKVKCFESARERGFGHSDPRKIEIRGKKIEEVFKKLWLPYLGGLNRWPEYDIKAEGACSSCQGLLAFTMERLKALGEYDKHTEISVLVGRKKGLPKKAQKDIILLGDCLKKWRGQGVYIAGCPPGERYPIWSIINRSDSENYAAGNRDAKSEAEEARLVMEYVEKLRRRSSKD